MLLALRGLLPALVLGLAGPLAAAAPAAADDGTARASLLGYLWGDGYTARQGWTFRSCHDAVANNFAESAHQIGADVRQDERKGGDCTRLWISGVDLDVGQSGMPADLLTASSAERRAFLAAVIEGEGNQNGQVLDDPEDSRAEAIAWLLRLEGIGTSIEGGSYLRVFADRSDWDRFSQFPFVDWSRVPGGH